MIYVSNAFSLQMLPDGLQIMVKTVSIEAVQQRLAREPWCSIIGHADTAAVVSNQLGFSVRHDRKSINLMDGDVLYVAQLTGGRLPEGASELPDGFRLEWREVTVYAYAV